MSEDKTYYRYRIFTIFGSVISVLSECADIDILWNEILNCDRVKFLRVGDTASISSVSDLRIRPSSIGMIDNPYGNGPVIRDGKNGEPVRGKNTKRVEKVNMGQQVRTPKSDIQDRGRKGK